MWEMLFNDLESQWVGNSRLEREGEITDMRQAEAVEVAWWDRLRSQMASPIKVRLRNGTIWEHTLVDCGPDWLLLGSGLRRWLINARAVDWITPVGRVQPAQKMAHKIRFTFALRSICETRAPVGVTLFSGNMKGTIVQVGSDHVVFADANQNQKILIPLTAIYAVSSG